MTTTRTVITSIDKVDFAELRRGKLELVEIAQCLRDDIKYLDKQYKTQRPDEFLDINRIRKNAASRRLKRVNSIIHFLDAFQDSAAECLELNEKIVFGKLK